MQLIHPGHAEAKLCLRAMATAVARRGTIPPAANALMAAAERLVLNIDHDIDALAEIGPAELAAGIVTPGLADQVVHAMLVGVLADGEPEPECYARVEAFGSALGVTAPALRTVRLLCEHHMVLFTLDFLRHSPMREAVVQQYQTRGGIIGVAKAALGLRGLRRDPALAERYIALGELPAGTFGHAYFHHCRDHGFSFPGEPKGFPEGGVFHDLTHVLAGYDTTPEGETQVGAFTSGYKRVNPMYALLVPVLVFGTGVNLTPSPQPPITGILAESGLAELLIRAHERGARVNRDLSDRWDFWPWMPMPLAQAREQLNIC
jgi:hypothetical protein